MPPTSTDNGSSSERAERDLSRIPCKFFKLGACAAGSSCPFSHAALIPGAQKEICEWFVKGNCKFGHRCALAHVLPGQSMSMDRRNKRTSQLRAEASNEWRSEDGQLGAGEGQKPTRNLPPLTAAVDDDEDFGASEESREESTSSSSSTLPEWAFSGNAPDSTDGPERLWSISRNASVSTDTYHSQTPPTSQFLRSKPHLPPRSYFTKNLNPPSASLKNPEDDTHQFLGIFPAAPSEESLLRGQLTSSRDTPDPGTSRMHWHKPQLDFQDDMWDESDTVYGPSSPLSLSWLANLSLPEASGRNSSGDGAHQDHGVELRLEEYFPSLTDLLPPEDRHMSWHNLNLAPSSGNGSKPVFSILQQILLHDGSSALPGEDLIWMKSLLASYERSVLQDLADFIQSQLDSPSHLHSLTSRSALSKQVFDRRCLRILRYLSDTHHILPMSLTIADIIQHGHRPVAGGGFADIWRGILGEQPVCLKVLRLIIEPDENVRKSIRKQFYNEALIWRQLKHTNILPLLGVNVELFSPSFCLISPWMANKDVISYLKQHPSHSRLSVFLDISAGLSYLHTKITHGDIRGANILVTDDLHCCLADFGLALTTSDSQAWSVATTGSMKGAIRWMAPELMDTNGITDQVLKSPLRDIFALGCTMLEIVTLRVPFHDQKTDYAVLACLMSGKRPARPEHVWCPDYIWNLIIRCWAQEPAHRPDAQQVFRALGSFV